MKRLLFDAETNGFLETVDKVHCIAAGDLDTNERFVWGPEEIPQALETLDKADLLAGHNHQRYDIPVLAKVCKWKPRPEVVIRDTMILARLMYPNVKATDPELIRAGKMPAGRDYAGKHTIASWGYRLGIPKIGEDITDWSTWTPYMQDRCVGDANTNIALWHHLKPEAYSQAAIELEHRIARVCDDMERYGVPFDMAAAGELHSILIGKKDVIEKRLVQEIGTWLAPISPDPKHHEFTPKKPDTKRGYSGEYAGEIMVPVTKKDGTVGTKKQKVFNGYPVCKLKVVEFNPGSRDHIAHVLLGRGWEPTEFTPGGKPEINEGVVASVVLRYPDLDGLGEFLMLDKRLSQLSDGDQAWIKHVKPDGNVHGVVNPMGTITSRASHFWPNLGQVPATKKPYGKECRALFGTAKMPRWKFVGADQEGLELRVLAHYLALKDGGKYAKVVTEGDPHWLHACVMGLAEGERDKHSTLHTILREDGSKRFIYAYIYGCHDVMAGEIIFNCLLNARRQCGAEGAALFREFFGGDNPSAKTLKKVGAKVRASFLKRIDGFADLKDRIAAQVNQFGWVPGLDGRRIPTRSDHSALNFMIQSGGAIVCKEWVCDAMEDLERRYKKGWDGDFVPCLWVHDEDQVAAREEIAQDVGETLVKFARTAGKPFGLRVPLDSKYKIGSTWADTH